MKLKYKNDFKYDHKIQGGFDFDCEQEPYYSLYMDYERIRY